MAKNREARRQVGRPQVFQHLDDAPVRRVLSLRALGHFDDLLHAIAKDPAMEIYLDTAQNRRGSPNENFAREVMELFTLGEGRYTEQDVKEAARAFTGWSLDRDTGTFVFRRWENIARVSRRDATFTRCMRGGNRFLIGCFRD